MVLAKIKEARGSEVVEEGLKGRKLSGGIFDTSLLKSIQHCKELDWHGLHIFTQESSLTR